MHYSTWMQSFGSCLIVVLKILIQIQNVHIRFLRLMKNFSFEPIRIWIEMSRMFLYLTSLLLEKPKRNCTICKGKVCSEYVSARFIWQTSDAIILIHHELKTSFSYDKRLSRVRVCFEEFNSSWPLKRPRFNLEVGYMHFPQEIIQEMKVLL